MPATLACILATDPATLGAARALRRQVFVDERGAAAETEDEHHDDGCAHAVVVDAADPGGGVMATARYRIGHGWTAREFDLGALTGRGLRIAEIGRTCVAPGHRDGMAATALFAGVVAALREAGAEALVGAASFPGRDPARHMDALRALRAAALAPAPWRPLAIGPGAVAVAGEAPRRAMIGVPPLVKAYLRAGAWVGEGACVDAAFNVVDVCVVLDMTRLRLPRAMAAAAP